MITGLFALAGCVSTPRVPPEYEVLGVVSEIPEDRKSVVLLHEAIPGYMQSMTMSFAVADSSLLDGVRVGTEVRFHLVVDANGAVIDDIAEAPGYFELFPEFELSTLEGRDDLFVPTQREGCGHQFLGFMVRALPGRDAVAG